MAIRKAEVLFLGDAASLVRAARQAEAAMAGVAAEAKKTTASGGFGAGALTAVKRLAMGVTGLAAVSVDFATKFQQHMEMIHTQAGASQGEVNRLSKAVLNLSLSTEQGPQKLAEALYILESVGMRGTSAMKALAAASKGAAIGNADLTDTTDALAGVMVALHEKGGQAARQMAAIDAVVGVGKMHMQDFVDSLKSGIIPTAAAVGLSFRSITAGLATMTDAGVPAEMAATKMRTILLMLAHEHTSAATAGLKSVGLTADELATAMRKPGNGLLDVLQLLHDHMQNLSKVKKVDLLSSLAGGSRSSGTLITLEQQLTRVGNKYQQIGNLTGKFNQRVAAESQTTSHRIKVAWSIIQTAFIQVGQKLLPIANTIIGAFSKFAVGIEKDKGIGGEFRDAIVSAFTAIKGVVLGVVHVIETLVNDFQKGKVWVVLLAGAVSGAIVAFTAYEVITTTIKVATEAWAVAQGALNLILEANPIVLIGTAIAVVVGAVVMLAVKTNVLTDAWKILKGAFTDTAKWIVGAAKSILAAVVSAWTTIKTATVAVWNWIKNALKNVWNAIVTVFKNSSPVAIVASHWTAIKNFAVSIWNTIKSWLSGAWHTIERTASSIWDGIGGAITGAIGDAIRWVKGAVHNVTGWLSGAWHTITKGVAGFATDIKNGVVKAFTGAVNLVIGFINDIISAIDLIPGVNIHKIKPLSTGGSGAGHSQGAPGSGPGGGPALGRKATGGALVDHPMFIVGEEAPKHPEYVIATNPAYRKRNLGLWAEAGRKIGVPGFAQGGALSQGAIESVWKRAGGPASNASVAAAIADAESSGIPSNVQKGQPYATTGWGLWQITPGNSEPRFGVNSALLNPFNNAEAAVAKYRGAGSSFSPWTTFNDGAYKRFLGGGGGVLGAIGGALSGAMGTVSGILGKMLSGGASAITSLLPGVGSLPKWLRGMGSSVLGDVTRWIKHKVSGVISSLFGGGGGGGPQGTVPAAGGPASKVQAKMFGAASSIVGDPYIWGGGHGSFISPGYDCSGAVSYVLHAANLLSSPETTAGLASYGLPGRGKYITIGVSNGGPGGGHTMMNMFGRYFESGGGSGKGVHWDAGWSQGFQGYRHPAGYKMGGIPRARGGAVVPGYVYRVGEQGPEDVAFGHSGTVMTAAQTRRNRGGGDINIEKAYFTGTRAAKATVDRLAFRAAIGTA